MKRTLRILALLLTAALLFALASCGGGKAESGTCTVVIGEDPERVFTVDLSKVTESDGLFAILSYLAEEKSLRLVTENGPFGAYITGIGTLTQNDAAGEYIGIWTSVAKDADVSQYATTREWNGTVLTSAGVGASLMTVEDGATIYIGILSYS